MVHSDLNVSNLLVRQGQIVGVIDIDAAGRGCAAYDLMSPVINGVYWGSDPIAIERLVSYGLDVYGPGPLAVATASVLIEVTNWYLSCSPAHIEQRAERLLRWLSVERRRLPSHVGLRRRLRRSSGTRVSRWCSPSLSPHAVAHLTQRPNHRVIRPGLFFVD